MSGKRQIVVPRKLPRARPRGIVDRRRSIFALLLVIVATCSCSRETPHEQATDIGGPRPSVVTSEWIVLGDGHRAYRAAPRNGDGPRVMLLHAWWGLNPTIQPMSERLAEAGFVVVAPDLYDGLVVETIEDAEREVNRIPLTERMGTVDAALARLGAHHRLPETVAFDR